MTTKVIENFRVEFVKMGQLMANYIIVKLNQVIEFKMVKAKVEVTMACYFHRKFQQEGHCI